MLSNAVYLQSEGGDLVGLVDSRKANGPITIRVSGLEGTLSALRDMAGRGFVGDGTALNISQCLDINMQEATPWVPPAITLTASPHELRETLRELHSIICSTGAKLGLGPLALAMPLPFEPNANPLVTSYAVSGDPLQRRATHALTMLEEGWNQGDAESAASSATRLLGLGPGLTPSGDDFLAGLLATLKWFEQYPRRQHAPHVDRVMAEVIVREAQARTTTLSSQLLAHAANGLLYEPAMTLGAALLTGQTNALRPAAQQLFEIGHTSGTDMAMGMLVGALKKGEGIG